VDTLKSLPTIKRKIWRTEIPQPSLSTKALTDQYNSGREDTQEAMELFSLEMILCVESCNDQWKDHCTSSLSR